MMLQMCDHMLLEYMNINISFQAHVRNDLFFVLNFYYYLKKVRKKTQALYICR